MQIKLEDKLERGTEQQWNKLKDGYSAVFVEGANFITRLDMMSMPAANSQAEKIIKERLLLMIGLSAEMLNLLGYTVTIEEDENE